MLVFRPVRNKDAVACLEHQHLVLELYLKPSLQDEAEVPLLAPVGRHGLRIFHKPQLPLPVFVDLATDTFDRGNPFKGIEPDPVTGLKDCILENDSAGIAFGEGILHMPSRGPGNGFAETALHEMALGTASPALRQTLFNLMGIDELARPSSS